ISRAPPDLILSDAVTSRREGNCLRLPFDDGKPVAGLAGCGGPEWPGTQRLGQFRSIGFADLVALDDVRDE
ncbi:MAG: hypothetical protein J2P53_17815, partial [Bradyrhizobiaceae bacterium]|nr:hypothetical protein [Bradyrhizobiaceae bacterium]